MKVTEVLIVVLLILYLILMMIQQNPAELYDATPDARALLIKRACDSLANLINRKLSTLPKPLVSLASKDTLTNIRLDVKNLLPDNIIPFLKAGDPGKGKGDVLSVDIAIGDIKGFLTGLKNTKFEKADDTFTTVSLTAMMTLHIGSFNMDNIKLFQCPLSSIKLEK